MNGKLIAMLAGSAVSGAAIGVVSTMHYFKKKYEAAAQKEIEEMRTYFYKKEDYVSHEEEPVPEESPVKKMNDEQRAEIKKKLKKNWDETTNYASYYKGTDQNEKMDSVEDEELPAITEEELDERKKNMGRPPKLISVDSLGELPQYVEMEAMFYYTYDDTITDENDQVVEDPEQYLGDCLTKYGFNESDEEVIYVLNFELDKVYEITKVDASYTTNKMYDGMYEDS